MQQAIPTGLALNEECNWAVDLLLPRPSNGGASDLYVNSRGPCLPGLLLRRTKPARGGGSKGRDLPPPSAECFGARRRPNGGLGTAATPKTSKRRTNGRSIRWRRHRQVCGTPIWSMGMGGLPCSLLSMALALHCLQSPRCEAQVVPFCLVRPKMGSIPQ